MWCDEYDHLCSSYEKRGRRDRICEVFMRIMEGGEKRRRNRKKAEYECVCVGDQTDQLQRKKVSVAV